MNELQNFSFNGNQLRTILINNEPFFVGKDAAVAIGYKNFRDALKAHVKEKYKRESRITTPSGTQTFTVISEPGLYQLAGESKLPSAEPFQDWVYEEVLPTIRKTGGYQQPQIPTTQRELVQLALSANEETNQRVDDLNDRLTEIEQNKLITTEDKGTIDAHVRKKVYSICKDFKYEKEARSMLFQELGSNIKRLFNVPNRGRIKDIDFMKALEFIDSWQPSSVVKAQINQPELF